MKTLEGLSILLVDDDQEFAGYVRRGLEDEGAVVTAVHDGGTGLRFAERNTFHIILMDVMMPGLTGFEVTKRLRLQKYSTPIVLLTARDAPEDIVKGLDAGADDYLSKPFEFEVFLARVRARTRFARQEQGEQLRYADLRLDPEKHQVFRGKQLLELTQTEFGILETLMKSAGRVVPRSRIIEQVWGDREASVNNLDVFIRYLRSKLDLPGTEKLLHTERGIGYVIRTQGK